MGLFDELAEYLGEDAAKKLRDNPRLLARTSKAGELLSYYDGTDVDDAPPAKKEDDPPARTSNTDLSAITASLTDITKKLGDIPATVNAAVDAAIKTRGDELVQAASGRALRQADELNRIYRRHEKDFGTEFDGTAFDKWADEQLKAGRRFDSVTDAYEKYTDPDRRKLEISNGVREELKKRNQDNSGQQVSGVTPPSSKAPISVFMRRGKEADGENKTSVDRAGEALAARMAAKASEA